MILRKIKTKRLEDIIFNNINDVWEYGGNVFHREYTGVITSFMVQRLGQVVDIVIDNRDEYGCVWQPWMIEKEIVE